MHSNASGTGRCEYRMGIDSPQQPPQICTLDCLNGGTCRNGTKDTRTLRSLGLLELANETHDGNFQYCECPDGFIGVRCDRPVKACVNSNNNETEHVCLYGGTCAKADGTDEFECNCETAFSNSVVVLEARGLNSSSTARAAGRFCEYVATSFCTSNGQPGVGSDEMAFCVNGGICNQIANGTG